MSKLIHIDTSPPLARQALYACVAVLALAGLGWQALHALTRTTAPARSSIAPRIDTPGTAGMAPSMASTPQMPAPPTTQRTAAVASPAPPPEAVADDDIRARNAGIALARLTTARPRAAEAFLSEVHVAADPRGGFVVREVLAHSRYDRMGLRPGDVIYTLDTPKMAAVDESSIVALMQQTELELEVYRQGSALRLHHAFNLDDGPAASADEAR